MRVAEKRRKVKETITSSGSYSLYCQCYSSMVVIVILGDGARPLVLSVTKCDTVTQVEPPAGLAKSMRIAESKLTNVTVTDKYFRPQFSCEIWRN